MSDRLKSLVYVDVSEPDGRLDDTGLPLHITVVPPFLTDASDSPRLSDVIEDVLRDIPSFHVAGAQDDYFGNEEQIEAKSIHVRKIGVGALNNIHDLLISGIADAGFPLDMTYAGAHYVPRSTYIGENGVGQDQLILVNSMVLAQKQAGGRWKQRTKYYLRDWR